eukprot:GEMP01015858.1.p1 GENE.GEMP01015858.1~~GEMP01015858.1.p1  ORF type:complete len:711 (+),score=105.61 GEMP01015858.1:53-2134(+)
MAQGLRWQVLLCGEWKDVSEGQSKMIEDHFSRGALKFKFRSDRQIYDINIDKRTQTNVASGKCRKLRRYPADGDDNISRTSKSTHFFKRTPTPRTLDVSAGVNLRRSSRTSPPSTAPDEEREPPKRKVFTSASMAIDERSPQITIGVVSVPASTSKSLASAPQSMQRSTVCGAEATEFSRLMVWLQGEWKNVSHGENAQIRVAIDSGLRKFPVEARGEKYTIDLTNPNKPSQINLRTGRTRLVKIAKQRIPLSAPQSPLQSKISRPAATNTAPFTEPQRITNDFKFLAGLIAYGGSSIETVRRAFRRANGQDLDLKLLTELCVEDYSELPADDKELVDYSLSSWVSEISVSGTNVITENEWIHYFMLRDAAPTHHAFEAVVEKLTSFSSAPGNSGAPTKLLSMFESEESELQEGKRDALHRCVEEWKYRGYWKTEIDEADAESEDVGIDYYDFLNKFLNRQEVDVELWLYDLTGGKLSWASSFLLGKKVEGIWHSSIVVFGKEYWFGGRCFESLPGSTAFGQPVKMIALSPTMRSRKDLWDHISRKLSRQFTSSSYDVLKNNCNHFSNKIAWFLNHAPIPDDIANQSQHLMDTWAARAALPFMNKILGRNTGSEEQEKYMDHEEQRLKFNALQVNQIVQVIQQLGDRPIQARIIRRTEDTLRIRWYDPPWVSNGGTFLETDRISQDQVVLDDE